MEIVLQWLDDLDDLVFVGFLKWESLRRRSLQAGLFSTLTLALCNSTAVALDWLPFLAAIAVCSIGLWAIAAAAGPLLVKRSRSVPVRA